MVKLTEVEDEHFKEKPTSTKSDALLLSDDEDEDYTDTGMFLSPFIPLLIVMISMVPTFNALRGYTATLNLPSGKIHPLNIKQHLLILDYFTLESEISTDSFDDNLDNETLYERICALQDIIPAQSRYKISNAFSSFSSFAKSTISFGGSALWIVSTSAFLLGVPWALALAEEQQYVQMEREQGMIKGANEMLTPGATSALTAPDSIAVEGKPAL
ncbi:mitochondrial import receptor subunit tom22 [Trichophyton benhamiae CBS 112371]|uniref:Mitochondrial import receptor subunit tom22 n=1 Tax=Arthroderma benhamiae (strain ATCC MYA-4681 / CBS 112371) TaxID=663331 RepID=D4AJ90_ARTBC|nr:mitochondrial import receptor subunit tom22 [Trichophyton benhamiae CBS 112371]EFE36813.1 mitochondrial import receptor subunit tom22 [Trichophyton benhamiae CBS 112371]